MTEHELMHFGILGQKWGVRRYQNEDGTRTSAGKKRYTSTGLRATIARKQNEKVDKSFQNWQKGSNNRANAIEAGKKMNEAKIAYINNKSDKSLRKAYKESETAYNKALRNNTTYRKGQVRKEVGQDMSRKYLSEAKKVGKLLDKDPGNSQLQKQYNSLMSQHDIERAKARKAESVAANRSATKAGLKRAATMTVKAAAGAAVVGAGLYVANKYLTNHDVTLNGQSVRVNMDMVNNATNIVNLGKKIVSYMY